MKKKRIYSLISFVTIFFLHASYYIIWKGYYRSNKWVQVEKVSWFSNYFEEQNYFLSLSYALAVAFIVYAFFSFVESRKSSITGVAGGLTITGVIYFLGCFSLGCCGSPMLTVYLSLLGTSFLPFAKPLVFGLTAILIWIGFYLTEKKAKKSCGESCCTDERKN